MRKIYVSLLFAVLSLCGVTVWGASYKSIVITKTDGSTLAVSMEYDMLTEIKAGNLTLTSSKGEIVIPTAEVRKWTYSTNSGGSDSWAGIETVESDGLSVIQYADRVVFDNLPDGSVVCLVSVDGRVISREKVKGHHEVSLSSLDRGIYVLTYNNNSLKIVAGQ